MLEGLLGARLAKPGTTIKHSSSPLKDIRIRIRVLFSEARFGLCAHTIMCGIGSYVILLSLAEDGIDVKQSCAIVAAVHLLFFALFWYESRHARFVFAGGTWRRVPTEATTNTPSEPKRKVIPVDDAAQLV